MGRKYIIFFALILDIFSVPDHLSIFASAIGTRHTSGSLLAFRNTESPSPDLFRSSDHVASLGSAITRRGISSSDSSWSRSDSWSPWRTRPCWRADRGLGTRRGCGRRWWCEASWFPVGTCCTTCSLRWSKTSAGRCTGVLAVEALHRGASPIRYTRGRPLWSRRCLRCFHLVCWCRSAGNLGRSCQLNCYFIDLLVGYNHDTINSHRSL